MEYTLLTFILAPVHRNSATMPLFSLRRRKRRHHRSLIFVLSFEDQGRQEGGEGNGGCVLQHGGDGGRGGRGKKRSSSVSSSLSSLMCDLSHVSKEPTK